MNCTTFYYTVKNNPGRIIKWRNAQTWGVTGLCLHRSMCGQYVIHRHEAFTWMDILKIIAKHNAEEWYIDYLVSKDGVSRIQYFSPRDIVANEF